MRALVLLVVVTLGGCTRSHEITADASADDVLLVGDTTTPPRDGAPSSVPRPIAPLSGSVVGVMPRLRWEPGAGSTATLVVLARDRAFSIISSTVVVDGEMEEVEPLAEGRWYWRLHAVRDGVPDEVSSAVWSFTVDATTGSRTGVGAVGSTGRLDVDGDGFDDLLVGAPGAIPMSGHVYVYRGGPDGLRTPPTTTLIGAGPESRLGNQIRGVGDVDGDGHRDVVMPEWRPERHVAVYRGGSGGLSVDRVLVVPNVADASEEYYVAAAGDVDADGHADVLTVDATRPRLFVHLGSPAGFGSVVVIEASDAAWATANGFATAAADLDDDGRSDVLYASSPSTFPDVDPVRIVAFRSEGRAFARSPWATLTSPALVPPTTGLFVVDADDDGGLELLVAAPNAAHGTGGVLAFDHVRPGETTVATGVFGAATGAYGIPAPIAVGDVDGDGWLDLLTGEPGGDSPGGRVEIHAGGPTGFASTATRTILGPTPPIGFEGTGFGTALSLGDFDADGHLDLAIGTPGYDCHGRVWIYRGVGGGLSRAFTEMLVDPTGSDTPTCFGIVLG